MFNSLCEIDSHARDFENCSACEVQITKLTSAIRENFLAVVLTVNIILCVSSFATSFVNMVVLTRPSMTCCSLSVLLTALEFSNLLTAVTFAPPALVLRFTPWYLTRTDCAIVLTFFLSVAWGSTHVSSALTPVVAAWKLIAVTKPHKAKQYLTRSKAIFITSSMFLTGFATSMSFNYAGNWGFFTRPCLCNECDFKPKAGFIYNWNGRVWESAGYFVTIVFVVLPSVLYLPVTGCLIWNLLVIAGTCRERLHLPGPVHKPSVRSIIVLIILLSCFVVTNLSPYVTFFQSKFGLPMMRYPWRYVFDQFLLGLAVNIFSIVGYYNMGTKYRETLWEICGFKTKSSRQNSSMRVDIACTRL